MKDLFIKIGKFFMDNLYISLIAILILLGLIGFFVVMYIGVKKKKKHKQINENVKKQETFTEEEIENIANNVSDKQQFIETIAKPSTEESKLVKKQVKGKKGTTTEEEKTESAKPKKKSTTKKVKEEKPAEIVEESNIVVETPTEITKPKKKKSTTKKVEEEKPTETVEENNIVVETPTETEQVKTSKRNYFGKWKIKQDDGKYFAELIASNGGVLLTTEPYTTLTGLKNGIETIKKNINEGNFTINSDKYGHFRFKLYSKLNRIICISEDYSSKAKCEKGIESVKRFAKDAYIIVEEN